MTILRQVRDLQDLSMKTLSINVNIPVSTLYDVEIGRRSIGASKATEIAKYYNVSVEELFIPTYNRIKVV
ncbi:helix-turn-helix transcriptional regulator [Bacillus thuringiensis]|uniref:helix-turn-helix domain-containing protein n=1 Tax=Bacillus thuringiensis TaxID=1428 RepID=UPI0034592F32